MRHRFRGACSLPSTALDVEPRLFDIGVQGVAREVCEQLFAGERDLLVVVIEVGAFEDQPVVVRPEPPALLGAPLMTLDAAGEGATAPGAIASLADHEGDVGARLGRFALLDVPEHAARERQRFADLVALVEHPVAVDLGLDGAGVLGRRRRDGRTSRTGDTAAPGHQSRSSRRHGRGLSQQHAAVGHSLRRLPEMPKMAATSVIADLRWLLRGLRTVQQNLPCGSSSRQVECGRGRQPLR